MTRRQRWTLVATIIGSGAVFLDGTIVNIALQQIGQELPATLVGVLEGQAYVVSGYLAVLAALLILAGALSDHYGRRRVYASASPASASRPCCAASRRPSRCWSSSGCSRARPARCSSRARCRSSPRRSRAPSAGRAFGMWAAATSALTVLGPIVGGTLVDTIGWRVAFLINVPLLAVALWATLRHVEESRDTEATGRFDWLGAVVAALAVGGLAFGLIRGQAQEWADPVAWVAIGVGVVALVAFPILMATRPNPLVPLGLFRSRAFATINLATFFIYGALYVTFGYQSPVPPGRARLHGHSAPRSSGCRSGIMLTLLSTRVGTLAGRIGAGRSSSSARCSWPAGLLWYARIPADSAPWKAASRPSTLDPAARRR